MMSCNLVRQRFITIEIENVNTSSKELEKMEKVYPQPHVIELIKDKRKQKFFINLEFQRLICLDRIQG